MREVDTEPDTPNLAIATDKVCFLLVKARQFDEKVADSDPDSGSNATDDDGVDVLEDKADDPVREELASFIHDLNVDERTDLVALVLLGRGDGDLGDWLQLQAQARDVPPERTVAYLLGMPLLSDYLDEGLAQCGRSCAASEADLS